MTEILNYLFGFLFTMQYNLQNIAPISWQSLDVPLWQQQVCKRSYPNHNGNGIWAELVMENKAKRCPIDASSLDVRQIIKIIIKI